MAYKEFYKNKKIKFGEYLHFMQVKSIIFFKINFKILNKIFLKIVKVILPIINKI
jgi:hypothetical protein